MGSITRGFFGRRSGANDRLPPGQYLTEDFPVLSAGPTPAVSREEWTFSIRNETSDVRAWTWEEFNTLSAEEFHVDIHCVTRWSKLDSTWRGVSLDTLLAEVETEADYALAHCHGGYTTNVPLADLLEGQAWVVYEFDGEELPPEHGGPARLLVPHLYFWKSAKWVRELQLLTQDEPGFWESLGYHHYGDPWHEQRYQGD